MTRCPYCGNVTWKDGYGCEEPSCPSNAPHDLSDAYATLTDPARTETIGHQRMEAAE